MELGACGADVVSSRAADTVLDRAVEALSVGGGEAGGAGGAGVICVAGETVRKITGNAGFVQVVHGEGG